MVPLNVLFGVPTALVLARNRFRGKSILQAVIDLPFAVSPVVVGVALILRASGSVAAFLTGTNQPAAGPASGLGVLFNPGDPATALEAEGLNVVAYWTVAIVLLALLAAPAIGSFLGVLVEHLPQGRDVLWSRSCCDDCHTVLGPRDLVPLASAALSRMSSVVTENGEQGARPIWTCAPAPSRP